MGQRLPESIACSLGEDASELIINHWHPSHQIVIFIGKLIKNTFTTIIYCKGCVVWTLVTWKRGTRPFMEDKLVSKGCQVSLNRNQYIDAAQPKELFSCLFNCNKKRLHILAIQSCQYYPWLTHWIFNPNILWTLQQHKLLTWKL